MEVWLARGKGFELFAVVELAFVAGAIHEPDIFALAAIDARVGAGPWEQPLRKTAHGSDTCACGNKDGVGDGLAHDEMAVRAVHANGSARGQVGEVGKMVGKEALWDAIYAEFEPIGIGSRGDGVGAGLLLPVCV